MVNSVRPKKSLGQHFLTDPAYCRRIVQFAAVNSKDLVIEVGPGTGLLTQHLLESADYVLGLEIDPTMVEILNAKFSENDRLQVVTVDVLSRTWINVVKRFIQSERPAAEGQSGFHVKVIGNLPYNISTRIITQMTRIGYRFHSCTFMTQKEVAERALANPGSKDYGFLSLIVDLHFDRHRGFDVPPGAFRPVPKVNSHVFQLTPRVVPISGADYKLFVRIISRGFLHRRKTLLNNLIRDFKNEDALLAAFAQCGIPRNARAENLSLEQYLCMTRVLSLPDE